VCLPERKEWRIPWEEGWETRNGQHIRVKGSFPRRITKREVRGGGACRKDANIKPLGGAKTEESRNMYKEEKKRGETKGNECNSFRGTEKFHQGREEGSK